MTGGAIYNRTAPPLLSLLLYTSTVALLLRLICQIHFYVDISVKMSSFFRLAICHSQYYSLKSRPCEKCKSQKMIIWENKNDTYVQNISYSLQALCHRRDEFRVVMSSVDESFIFPQYIIKNNKLPKVNVIFGSFLFFDYLLFNKIWKRYFTRLPSLCSGRRSGMGWVGVSVTAGSNLIITLQFYSRV